MKKVTAPARGFIDELTSYLHGNAKDSVMGAKVKAIVGKVTAQAKQERDARVVTAVPVVPAEKASIERSLARILGHAVKCSYSVNPSLLGGMKITVADWVVDSSLATQLASIAQGVQSA